MNREVERNYGNFNNQEVRENILSPTVNRTIINTNSGIKLSPQNDSSFSNQNYSPFVIKKSSNLLGSNYSSTSSKKMFTDSQSYKIYTPSPNVIKERLSDRFIPMNKGLNLLEKFELTKKWSQDTGSETKNENNESTSGQKGNSNTYSDLLENNFFGNDSVNFPTSKDFITKPKNSLRDLNSVKSKLFSFREEQKRKSHGFYFNYNIMNTDSTESVSSIRKIGNKPYKKIDAPGLIDDFYLNLLDWSSKNDIAVGQNNSVYLWCANKTQCFKLLEYEGDKYVSSVIWSPTGNEVAVGNSDGLVEIWDVSSKKVVRILEGHSARVGVVAWNNNDILSTGSKDYSIINRDLRMNTDNFSKYQGHKQEVCGLKWSFDGTQLASGGNDNKLLVWDLHSDTPLMKSSHHTAAVKAIAWSPNQSNLLATGGGTADRCIRFWNTSNFSLLNCIDTGSQVCNLVFSKTSNELVSTHGYSLNQIILWKLSNMTKIATLTGHTYRVLYLGISPNGQNIVTGAGDQTLRFWNVFPPIKNNEGSCLFPSNMDIR